MRMQMRSGLEPGQNRRPRPPPSRQPHSLQNRSRRHKPHLHGQRYRTGCCGSTSRSRRATAASVQPPGARKCEPFFSLYTSVSNHRLQLLGSMDTTPISAFCRCAEVELSSRLQIMAPRIMRERNTCKRYNKRPQCLDEGQTASLGAHGTNCLGAPDFGFLHLRGSGAELSPSDYGAAHNAREKNLHKI